MYGLQHRGFATTIHTMDEIKGREVTQHTAPQITKIGDMQFT